MSEQAALAQVGASNELPESEELDALFDRFLIRRQVAQVSSAQLGSLARLAAGTLRPAGVLSLLRTVCEAGRCKPHLTDWSTGFAQCKRAGGTIRSCFCLTLSGLHLQMRQAHPAAMEQQSSMEQPPAWQTAAQPRFTELTLDEFR